MTENDLDALKASADRARRSRHAVGRRGELERQVRMARSRVDELQAEMTKEAADVRDLEGLSLSSVLARLAGDKDDKLARERAEADAARVRLSGQVARLAELERDLAEAVRLEGELLGSEDAYDRVLAARSAAIARQGGPEASRLGLLEKAIADLQAEIREYEEAKQAADDAESAVRAVLAHLWEAVKTRNSAEWGEPGSRYWAREGALQDAERAAGEAQEKLDRVATELADVGQRVKIRMPEVESSGFMGALFFDHISEAEWDTDATIAQVKEVGQKLDALADDLVTSIGEMESRLKEFEAQRESLLADS